MNTKVIFNTDKKLKEKAIRKARKQGTTLSTVLHLATKAYVNDDLDVDLLSIIDRGRREIAEGNVYSEEEVYRKLGIKYPK